MTQSSLPQGWVQFVPIVVAVVLLSVRMLRPQRISLTRLWITPFVFCALALLAIYGTQTIHPAPYWEVALGVVIGALAGAPFGVLRGVHTSVSLTDRTGVMQLGASWITALVYVVAFGLRYGIRAFAPHTGSLAGVVGDALMGFALAFIAASYVVIYRKYRAALTA